ncbi:Alpha-glucosidase [Dactylella cylindrospora]|nr:Alpha-glucosidase [Dactylella cylindrospora]
MSASINSNASDWWKTATGYHIYVPSFSDSNGDGIGDIPGILERLPHLSSLGVDFIWLSPFYTSPQNDMGYDISDYKNVHPPYGTVQDVQRLIDACHMTGLKIIFDLVVNHTSHLHSWFQSSRSGKRSDKRDWYYWRPPRYDADGRRRPPNNWMSVFGGSAWEWDEETQEYYFHIYLKEQPDLNWGHEALRKAVFDDAMRFWVNKGVDGFRIDTVAIYAKDPKFPDADVTNPNSEFQLGSKYYANLPKNFEYLREMREVLNESERDLVMIGEYNGATTPELALKYCGKDGPLDSGFHKQLMDIERTDVSKWVLREPSFELSRFMSIHKEWQDLVNKESGAWTTAFLENHDVARSVSRFANDTSEFRQASAKLLAVLTATSSGTLFIYQGQEIGMTSMPSGWGIEEYKDPDTTRYYDSVKAGTANGESLEYALSSIKKVARDHGRTPIQWDATANAGFTTAELPWMRVNDNYHEINVKAQESDPQSVMNFWRKLLRLRILYSETFVRGCFEPVGLGNSKLGNNFGLYWKRPQGRLDPRGENRDALVMLNFSSTSRPLDEIMKEVGPEALGPIEDFQMLISSYESGKQDREVISSLQPYEARVYLRT